MHTLFHPLRDSRRSFTETQKQAILHRQRYRCARCHYWLDFRATKFHHKKYWSQGGWTTTHNAVALCSICHDIIHHEETVWKTDYKPRRFIEVKKKNVIHTFISWIGWQ